MSGWVAQLSEALEHGPAVLVSVVEAAGSTPRTSGTRMVVTADGLHGTIGGGTLEFRAIRDARDMLAGGDRSRAHRFQQQIQQGPSRPFQVYFRVAQYFEQRRHNMHLSLRGILDAHQL